MVKRAQQSIGAIEHNVPIDPCQRPVRKVTELSSLSGEHFAPIRRIAPQRDVAEYG